MSHKQANRYGALALILAFGLFAIPGIEGANASVGPPLYEMAERSLIAGNLPNTPDNLVLWIQHPQQIEPGSDMPEMGISEPVARDIAAYLYEVTD
jgi:cytochrome c1